MITFKDYLEHNHPEVLDEAWWHGLLAGAALATGFAGGSARSAMPEIPTISNVRDIKTQAKEEFKSLQATVNRTLNEYLEQYTKDRLKSDANFSIRSFKQAFFQKFTKLVNDGDVQLTISRSFTDRAMINIRLDCGSDTRSGDARHAQTSDQMNVLKPMVKVIFDKIVSEITGNSSPTNVSPEKVVGGGVGGYSILDPAYIDELRNTSPPGLKKYSPTHVLGGTKK